MEKKSIEDLFKDSFENFEAEVNPSVWSNVKTGLKGIGLGLLGKTILNKIGTNTLVAMVSSAATVVTTVAVMHWTGNAVKNTEAPKLLNKTLVTVQPVVQKKEDIKETEKPIEVKNNSKIEASVDTEPMQETKIVVEPFHKDKKKIQSVINTYSKSPIALVFPSPNGGSVPLIVNCSNSGLGVTNKWKFGDGSKEEKGANPVHVYTTPGIYTVILTSVDANGNVSIDSTQKIEVTGNSSMSAIPREFSPNGDGDKDYFDLIANNMVKMTAVIFDEKGKTVFEWEWKGKNGKWGGKDKNGKDLKEGMYYYIETGEGKDGKTYERKGSIKLTR